MKFNLKKRVYLCQLKKTCNYVHVKEINYILCKNCEIFCYHGHVTTCFVKCFDIHCLFRVFSAIINQSYINLHTDIYNGHFKLKHFAAISHLKYIFNIVSGT